MRLTIKDVPNFVSECWACGVLSYEDLARWVFEDDVKQLCKEQNVSPEMFNLYLDAWDRDFNDYCKSN